ncbi:MAG: formate dehydrogenase accessory sulfurtransferase FdhD [Candidatus Omnitrophota bacterium]
MEEYEVCKIFPKREEKIVDLVTREVSLAIYVNGKEIVTLLASPMDIEELSVGFVFTAGLIKSFNEINKLTVDQESGIVYVELRDKPLNPELIFKREFTSNRGRETLFYNRVDGMHRSSEGSGITINRNQVFQIMQDFTNRSLGFKQTGGVHSAAIATRENILIIKEDIGRHNAIDKVLGEALMKDIDLKDKIILSSGRVSSEILLKIQKTPICMMISRGAPTDQAIKHARNTKMTLIGFARGQSMNVYNARERIL